VCCSSLTAATLSRVVEDEKYEVAEVNGTIFYSWCSKQQQQQALEHWLQTWLATHLQRLQILGTTEPPLDIPDI